MGEYRTYRDLDVWKKARSLVKEVYLVTRNFPKDEMYGLMSQMEGVLFLFHQILLKDMGGNLKRRRFSFCILPGDRFLNWRHSFLLLQI